MYLQLLFFSAEASMDITERQITKISREAEKLVLLSLR